MSDLHQVDQEVQLTDFMNLGAKMKIQINLKEPRQTHLVQSTIFPIKLLKGWQMETRLLRLYQKNSRHRGYQEVLRRVEVLRELESQ